jgi:hypothetical protein
MMLIHVFEALLCVMLTHDTCVLFIIEQVIVFCMCLSKKRSILQSTSCTTYLLRSTEKTEFLIGIVLYTSVLTNNLLASYTAQV